MNYPSLPTEKTKVLSVLVICSYLFSFGVGGYSTSIGKGQISRDEFTISQSLAYGDKPTMMITFTVGFIALIYLVYLRGPKKLLWFRFFLLFSIFGFLLTIIFVTEKLNRMLHFIFAGIMFSFNIIFVFLTYFLYKGYLENRSIHLTYIFDAIIIFSLSSFAFLLIYSDVSGELDIEEEKTFIDNEVFAISEILSVLATMGVIIFLGFF